MLWMAFLYMQWLMCVIKKEGRRLRIQAWIPREIPGHLPRHSPAVAAATGRAVATL